MGALAAGDVPSRIVAINPGTLAQTILTTGGNLATVTGMVVYTAKSTSSLVVTSSVNPATYGQNITFTARIN